jgi:hypothetical protein
LEQLYAVARLGGIAMRKSITAISGLLSSLVFGCACLAQTSSVPTIPAPVAPSVPDGILYNYQTLIGALIALAVGLPTILLLWRQLRQQYELKAEAAHALCKMFYEEASIYARFFVNIDAGFRKAIKDRTLDPTNLKYPDSIVFASQAARLSELDPGIALALMYFYQALMHLQQLSKRLSAGWSENEIKALTEAYDLTIAQLASAMGRMAEESRNVPVSPQGKALLGALRQIVIKK